MKYHIDTIPVWDALREGGECLFCNLSTRIEKKLVEGYLGGSLMEVDYRLDTNEKGFCARHSHMLYEADNKLGVALLTHTHLREINRKFHKRFALIGEEAKKPKGSAFRLRKSADNTAEGFDGALQVLSHYIAGQTGSCVICDRLAYDLDRYVYTYLSLWSSDAAFRKEAAGSKGVCLLHLKNLIDISFEALNEKKRTEFFLELLPHMQIELERLDGELKWFTEKFDYKNKDKPWGSSHDALLRTLQKLNGEFFE